jgi:hypothetical protein
LIGLCVIVCAAALFGLAVLLLLECDGVRRFELGLRIEISFGFAAPPAATTEAPPRPLSRRGRDPGTRLSTGTGHTTALFAQKSQSFLDNVVAGFGLRDHQAIQHCHDPPHTAPPCANHLSAFGAKRHAEGGPESKRSKNSGTSIDSEINCLLKSSQIVGSGSSHRMSAFEADVPFALRNVCS